MGKLMEQLSDAIDMSAKYHKGQFRKGGLPFICHPLEVMKKLTEWDVWDTEILIAAVYHDAQEDAKPNERESVSVAIREAHGANVANMVGDMTFIKGENYVNKKEYIKSFMSKDIRILATKLADRFCNVKDYLVVDKKYAVKYYDKASMLFGALKERQSEFIGCFGEHTFDLIREDYGQLAQRLMLIDRPIWGFEQWHWN